MSPDAAKPAAARPEALRPLLVLDRLEVGPITVEPKRLIAPYTLVSGKTRETTELVYRYEEAVFDPADLESVNLAAMMGAQLALNYGLFARELVFHGPFDRADRRFLIDMARNTAREIYVKKFLEPNPFLTGKAAQLDRAELDNYLQAEMVFPDGEAADRNLAALRGPSGRGASDERGELSWHGDPARHAVLSSGGKDSLLTFGLLREMGKEAHSIFINESGRHWFTALNGFRALSAEHPETARVWTNSDRLFAWMARRLSFVRPDFQNLRSDEYPIRLWTVAVFLFGALPLIRKRGIGRLLIGDEYDTTRRVYNGAIPHYDGLYDQSLYFDQAMSRYFGRKAWGLVQFSMLRPLSELLIQKTLTLRYPDLQRHQVSCHATHVEGERVHPCGDCEKCRRIVSMLTVIGADPAACGYSKEQIANCLRKVAAQGVHQDEADARHLGFLLVESGVVEAFGPGVAAPKEHPEVEKLRFDPERSPASAIPEDLRRPLFTILMEHARGAVKKSGRIWLDINPLRDPSMREPYAYEARERAAGQKDARSARSKPDDDATTGSKTGSGLTEERRRSRERRRAPDRRRPPGEVPNRDFLLAEMTWPEAETKFKAVDVALLPVGAIEQHGPHLPLDTDAYDADYLCREVARACTEPRPLVLPLIPYGVSYHHEDFRGTLSVNPETLSRVVYEVGMDVARHGIVKLIIINGHGGNSPALHFAAQMINRDAHIFTCVDTGESSDAEIDALAQTPNDVHAGEIETSTSLANRPELVHMDKAKRAVPRFSSEYLQFTSSRSVGWYARTSRLSKTGVMGDPTKASAEKGEKMWAIMIRNLVELVEDIKGLSLSQIHRSHH